MIPTPYVIVYNGMVLAEQAYYPTYNAAWEQIQDWIKGNKCLDAGQYRVVGLRRVS